MCIPIKISFEIPEWGESSTTSERWHNKTVKQIMRTQLEIQLANRVHRHFEFSAHSRYGYAERTKKYQRTKLKYRGKTTSWGTPVTFAPDANLDLIKTGTTRRTIKSGVRFTLAGAGHLILATLRLRLPFKGGTGRSLDLAAQLRILASGKKPNRKFQNRMLAAQKTETVRRTIAEIERFSADEITEINKSVAFLYAQSLKKARRVKKK